jgi:hypothetical protein
MQPDPCLGSHVEIHSMAGIAYSGVVRSIHPADELGELFELGSNSNPEYQRFIHVVDRAVQIRQIEPET